MHDRVKKTQLKKKNTNHITFTIHLTCLEMRRSHSNLGQEVRRSNSNLGQEMRRSYCNLGQEVRRSNSPRSGDEKVIL